MTTMAPAPAALDAVPAWGDRPDLDAASLSAEAVVRAAADRVFAAFADPAVRERWLTGVPVVVRFAIPPLHLRAAWADGIGEVVVDITSDHSGLTRVVVRHVGLPDAPAADLLERFWRDRLSALVRLVAP